MDSAPKTPYLETHNQSFDFSEVILLFFSAFLYLKLWLYPGIHDGGKIFQMSILLLFEFIVVHSGVFMAVFPKRISLFLFVPVYGMFAIAMNAILGDNNLILGTYALIVLNRMRFAFFNVSPQLKSLVILRSIISALVYFGIIMLFAFGNQYIPKGGLTYTVLDTMHYSNVVGDYGGLFINSPHIAMGAGFFYYTCIACIFLLMTLRPPRVSVQHEELS